MPILDFRELQKGPAGEDLEALVRELGESLGLKPSWSGRGADQGRDLFFTELRGGVIAAHPMRWLVSCKDHARSGRSAPEADAGAVLEKLEQHQAQGFLFVTTTTASTGLKAMLDSLHRPSIRETCVWDRTELERLLLKPQHVDIVRRYLPSSYTAWTRLSSLSQALEALDVLLPPPVAGHVRKVIDTYRAGEEWLTGEQVWPHDADGANIIDWVLHALLEGKDPRGAARMLVESGLEFDAFERLLGTLVSVRSEQTRALCYELVRIGESDGMALFAFRFLVDRYELEDEEHVALAAELSDSDLREIYEDEVSEFLSETIQSDPTRFSAWHDIDAISSQTTLEEAYPYDVLLKGNPQSSRIDFRASVTVSVTPTYDREEAASMHFPGRAVGHIDQDGMSLTEFTVDTSRFHE